MHTLTGCSINVQRHVLLWEAASAHAEQHAFIASLQ